MQKLLAFRLKHKLAAKMRIQGSHKPCTTSVQQLQRPQPRWWSVVPPLPLPQVEKKWTNARGGRISGRIEHIR